MTALARLQLDRVPAPRREEAAPRRLRDDLAPNRLREDLAPNTEAGEAPRDFGAELADEQGQHQPQVTPMTEQAALAALLGAVQPAPCGWGAVQPAPCGWGAVQPAQLGLELPAVGLRDTAQLADPTELALEPILERDGEASFGDMPATPLERAVLELLDRTDVPVEGTFKAEVGRQAVAAKVTAPVFEPRPLPEMAAPTSHVNLVMDDGDRRVVVTVAVRGNDVNVHMRGSDDLAASFARNAGSLDEAMRARGLTLAELSASRDSDTARQSREQPADRREPKASTAEEFSLEETR